MAADIQMITAEHEDLRTHVELCAQRYADVEQRLGRIERVLWAVMGIAAASGVPAAAAYLPAMIRVFPGI
jgi:hypothetical protein